MDPRLREAACSGDLAALSFALNNGADPNLADAQNYNPLFHAAWNGHAHCVTRLIEGGADPNREVGSSGRTVLHHAITHYEAGAVEALLAGGASVVCARWRPEHLIVLAVRDHKYRSHRRGSGRMIPLLLRAGASIPEGVAQHWRDYYQLISDPTRDFYSRSKIRRFEYLRAVQAAGGFPAYARAHRSIFVAIFSRGTLLPTDVLPTIVEYWAHLGWYQYHVPGTAFWARILSLRRYSGDAVWRENP
jgi:hypothetical protein